jgi:hypothetical protein
MLVSACMMMKKIEKEKATREREGEKEKTRPSFVSVHKRDETRRASLPDRTSYVWHNVLNEYIRTGRHISTIIFILLASTSYKYYRQLLFHFFSYYDAYR